MNASSATRKSRTSADARLAIGVAGLLLSGIPVRDHRIGPLETSLFRAVNSQPDWLYRPVWVVMQAGNVLAAPLAGGIALATGRKRLAMRVTVSGLATWTLAKVIKRCYRRPRPRMLIEDVRCRGPEASGLGYVSGHAAIAVAIVAAALTDLPPAARLAALSAAPTVALARLYVGAHLPLDVLGGAALGFSVDACVRRLIPQQ